jgi:hypothetical protein
LAIVCQLYRKRISFIKHEHFSTETSYKTKGKIKLKRTAAGHKKSIHVKDKKHLKKRKIIKTGCASPPRTQKVIFNYI